MEGAAPQNLDLLAEALISGAVDPEFAPDEGKRHAGRLNGLNRKEIIVLALASRPRGYEQQTHQGPPSRSARGGKLQPNLNEDPAARLRRRDWRISAS